MTTKPISGSDDDAQTCAYCGNPVGDQQISLTEPQQMTRHSFCSGDCRRAAMAAQREAGLSF